MSKKIYLSLFVLLFAFSNYTSAQIPEFLKETQRFYGEIIEEGVDLIWRPESESKNDHFIIEFETADKNWEKLEKLPSFGMSNRSRKYHFTHKNPLIGTNYYRLSQYNGAGKLVLRENAIVVYQKNQGLVPELAEQQVKDFARIHSPVPAILTIHSDSKYNIAKLQLEQGRNMIDVSSMEPGEYILEIETFEDTFVTRLSVEK